MKQKKDVSRRNFLSQGVRTVAGLTAAGSIVSAARPGRVLGANERINIAVIGINGRGRAHMSAWAKIPGVFVKTLCDPDTRLFPDRVKDMEQKQGKAPKTEVDIRKVLEDKEIHAVSIATCDHWHALSTVWACQAGKHVYVEKPVSHNIWEGRKMVEAARRYNRVVQSGMQNRSNRGVIEAMKFLHEGKLGDVYMAKGLCFKPRESIGHKANTPEPEGLNWDLWLGPAQWRPYNPNLVHYNWHWFWDFGCTDLGNQGPHQMDIARWGMNQQGFPKKIHCAGGYFAFDSDQETPNTQMATMEFEDGKILQFEVRGLYTNAENDIRIGNLFYGTQGWMHLDGSNWKTFFGRRNEPGPSYSSKEAAADPMNLAGSGDENHFENFIDAIRTNNPGKLTADIIEGHKSTAYCHLANIADRLDRQLIFDGHSERFENDDVANAYLTRDYRYPYTIPDKV